MPASTPMPYHDDEQDSTLKWVILFVALSLLAHALLLIGIIFLSKHVPSPRLEPQEATPATSITLIQPPPQAAPKPIFMNTPDDQKNVPHKEKQIQVGPRYESRFQEQREPQARFHHAGCRQQGQSRLFPGIVAIRAAHPQGAIPDDSARLPRRSRPSPPAPDPAATRATSPAQGGETDASPRPARRRLRQLRLPLRPKRLRRPSWTRMDCPCCRRSMPRPWRLKPRPPLLNSPSRSPRNRP